MYFWNSATISFYINRICWYTWQKQGAQKSYISIYMYYVHVFKIPVGKRRKEIAEFFKNGVENSDEKSRWLRILIFGCHMCADQKIAMKDGSEAIFHSIRGCHYQSPLKLTPKSQWGEIIFKRVCLFTHMHILVVCTDYSHTMAKSLILCVPNSNPNPKYIFGIWIQGLSFFVKIMVD